MPMVQCNPRISLTRNRISNSRLLCYVAHALVRAASAFVPTPGFPRANKCREESLDTARRSACATLVAGIRDGDFATRPSRRGSGRRAGRFQRGYIFLNNLSKALRASSGLRGTGGPAGPAACAPEPFEVPSRATVTRGVNRLHSLAPSFTAMRTGIGFEH